MKVVVNGQSYDDWSQVPEPLRQQLAATLPDADHNGVPDVFEGRLPDAGQHTFASTSIEVNGQHYGSVADLPPEIRTLLQQTLGGQAPAAQPASAAPPAPPAPAAPAAEAQPGPHQVILNGKPVVVADDGVTAPPKKGFLRRLLGG